MLRLVLLHLLDGQHEHDLISVAQQHNSRSASHTAIPGSFSFGSSHPSPPPLPILHPPLLLSMLAPLLAAGMEWDGSQPSQDNIWHAIKAVWASKWNSRAVSSLRKAGLQHGHLQMAVLCQPVIPAKYAFVAHTINPVTGAPPPCLLLVASSTASSAEWVVWPHAEKMKQEAVSTRNVLTREKAEGVLPACGLVLLWPHRSLA